MAILLLQARLTSSRLPAKGFLSFFDEPIWLRMIRIAKNIKNIDKIIFAYGGKKGEELTRSLLSNTEVAFFSGSEDNVLERFARAASTHKSDYVIRITCDNYLVQPLLIDDLLKGVKEANADYGFISPLSHYAGEIISQDLLIDYWKAGNYSDLAAEHVTYDFRMNPNIKKFTLDERYKGINHRNSPTLDTLDDFILMKKLEDKFPQMEQVNCLSSLQQLDRLDLA